ncbi:hypothetical protein EDC94DRAFT_594158 [Helicostylum pulchrum]|nr:hypothetical protein EDC94DRAFT_594158 [Helicostylum pulchrum]
MSSSLHHEPFLSLSCNKLDANDFGNMWTGFSKCKSYRDHGQQRLEYMSWRLWYCRQGNDRIDNNIKQIITSLLLSPAFPVHDAYSHEVPQAAQNCFQSTIQHHASINNKQQQQQHQHASSPILEPPTTTTTTTLSRSSSFCKVKDNTPSLTNSIIHTRTAVQEQEQEEEQDDDDDLDDDYEEDEDYYLSDDDDIYEDEQDDLDDINYQFVRDFTKTQPRPLIPRRSLLSDLLQRVSSPPSLLSNSSSSFTSNSTTTQHSIILDDDFNSTHHKHNNNTTASPNNSILTTHPHNEQRWKQSFRGW